MKDLSRRLEVITSVIPQGAAVCDVGTDHAHLPIFIRKTGKAKSVIATDIRLKPLNNAKLNIEKAQVSGVDLRLCDGLDGVKKGEADCIVIAGMGGEVISGIIERCSWARMSGLTFILQPMTSPEFLRKYLFDEGFDIDLEIPVSDNGKLYSVIKAVYKGRPVGYKPYELYSGRITANSPDGFAYIKKQYNRCFKCCKSLENIPVKKSDYLYFKEISQGLKSLLKSENANGI